MLEIKYPLIKNLMGWFFITRAGNSGYSNNGGLYWDTVKRLVHLEQ